MHRHGYGAVGVADICRAAGAKKGSFYHFFESKQALAVEMLEQSWERARSTLFVDAFGDDEIGAVDAFTRYGRLLASNLVRLTADHGPVPGCRFGNFASELGGADERIRRCVDQVFDEMSDRFEAVIRRGQARGELPADLDAAAGARRVLAHMEGLMVLAKAAQDPALLEDLGPAVARLLR